MRKLLFLLVCLAVAASASAGINKAPIKKNVAKYSNKDKTELVTPFKMDRVIQKQTLRTPVTEQPEGEVKTYVRAGACLYIDGQYVTPGDQDGFVDLIYAENNIVWFKNIFYGVGEIYGDSYVYGTLSADGTTITVPMGQSIYYSTSYEADIVLSFGTTAVSGSSIAWTPDESVTEVVYAIDGNKIILQGCGGAAPSGSDYPDYEYNGLGSVWTDDGTFGGFLEWETVFTYAIVPNVPEITVEPTATTAHVYWDADEKADGWNLRYRPWTDLSANPHEWTFPLDSYEEELEGWWGYDADGDGEGWGLAYSSDAQDDVCLMSGSYTSNGACYPDNWIGTPDVPLKGELRFTLWGRSNYYPEVLQVYALVGEDLYQLFEDSLVTTTTHTVYTVDLSAFDGVEGSIVFRNYSTYNQWTLYVDDIFVGDPNAEIIQPAPWEYANELPENEHTIEGLTPETKYEVQVMGYNEDFESAWCPIVEFITPANVYILGQVNDQDWAANAGTLMTYDAENNVYTATVNLDGRGESGENYFSFTKVLANDNDEGGWAYIAPFRIGADSEGDFWYDDMYDGQPLGLVYGQEAFRVMNGDYNLTLSLEDMTLIIERVVPEGLRGDVNGDKVVNISDVTALINILLNGTEAPAEADCNLDTLVNISDVTALINYLLNGTW